MFRKKDEIKINPSYEIYQMKGNFRSKTEDMKLYIINYKITGQKPMRDEKE